MASAALTAAGKVALLFALATAALALLASTLPSFDADEPPLSFPRDFDDVRRIAAQLHRYREEYSARVLAVYSAAYLWKQTFAIPGSMSLNVLGGALFGPWAAMLVIALTSVGATLCYAVSWACGAPLVARFDHRLGTLRKMIKGDGGRGRLFYELTLLRLVPLVPNWLANIASPHLGVPPGVFFLSVLIGMAPFSVISTQAGAFIHDVDTLNALTSPATMVRLVAVAALLAIPAIISRVRSMRSKPD